MVAASTAQLFCQGGQRAAKALALTLISLQQCGNAAFGECQRLAKDSLQSPCGFAFNGYEQCQKADFEGFYNGELLLLLLLVPHTSWCNCSHLSPAACDTLDSYALGMNCLSCSACFFRLQPANKQCRLNTQIQIAVLVARPRLLHPWYGTALPVHTGLTSSQVA